ncbi:hypothetical protein PIB30_001718 [Stylosanthes scabra]|uniref:Uncharacterized protein n=1 Tax=Stylosanthes scabra TaxID=79078 RepID=A0ABU6U4F7_9FABA|nr:hypothetical protein [Stylosanthes scabra]
MTRRRLSSATKRKRQRGGAGSCATYMNMTVSAVKRKRWKKEATGGTKRGRDSDEDVCFVHHVMKLEWMAVMLPRVSIDLMEREMLLIVAGAVGNPSE